MQQIRNVPCTSFIFLNYCIILNKHKMCDICIYCAQPKSKTFYNFFRKIQNKKEQNNFPTTLSGLLFNVSISRFRIE